MSDGVILTADVVLSVEAVKVLVVHVARMIVAA